MRRAGGSRSLVRRRAVTLLAAAAVALSGCTTKSELRAGSAGVDLTERWAEADIAQLPEGPLVHPMSRYELHDEVDPLQHLPGVPRTGYVVRYATGMERENVVDHYLRVHDETCSFDTSALPKGSLLTATCGDIAAEIRLVTLVHGPDELSEVRALRTEVLVFVTDR